MKNQNRTATRFNRNLLSCALVACLAMSAPAMAQSTSATLRGQVAAGTRITVTNVETGLSRSVEAGTTGSYTIPGLPPGTYRVDGGAGGSRNITLAVGQVATVDLGKPASAATWPRRVAEVDCAITGADIARQATSAQLSRLRLKRVAVRF